MLLLLGYTTANNAERKYQDQELILNHVLIQNSQNIHLYSMTAVAEKQLMNTHKLFQESSWAPDCQILVLAISTKANLSRN